MQEQVGVALGGGIGGLSAVIPGFSRLANQLQRREQVGGGEAQLAIGNGCFLRTFHWVYPLGIYLILII